MNTLREIMLATLKSLTKEKGQQAKLADKTVGRIALNDILQGRRTCTDGIMRKIQTALNYQDYEELLDIGRAELGLPLVRPKTEPSKEILPNRELELLRKLEEANDRIKQLEDMLAAERRNQDTSCQVVFKNAEVA